MKKLLCFFFVNLTLSASSQVFLKGAVFLLPMSEASVANLSIGSEYKHKQFGYEYMFNAYSKKVDGTNCSRNTHQLAV